MSPICPFLLILPWNRYKSDIDLGPAAKSGQIGHLGANRRQRTNRTCCHISSEIVTCPKMSEMSDSGGLRVLRWRHYDSGHYDGGLRIVAKNSGNSRPKTMDTAWFACYTKINIDPTREGHMADSLSSLLDGQFYLIWPDGQPVEVDEDSYIVIFRARRMKEIAFFDSYDAAQRIANYSPRGGFLRIMRIRVARSDKGTFLYSEWVPNDESEAPPPVDIRLEEFGIVAEHHLYEG